MRILENEAARPTAGIFNIGNPANDLSVARARAERSIAAVAAHPGLRGAGARGAGSSRSRRGDYYGEGYQDILTRVPSIRRARELLGWEPKVALDEAIRRTVDFYFQATVPTVGLPWKGIVTGRGGGRRSSSRRSR